MFYTYILYSERKEKFYIGSSENPEERLKKHNNKNKGFTNQSDDWKIVFLQAFGSKTEVMAFERKIKNWKSSKMIIKLINGNLFLIKSVDSTVRFTKIERLQEEKMTLFRNHSIKFVSLKTKPF